MLAAVLAADEHVTGPSLNLSKGRGTLRGIGEFAANPVTDFTPNAVQLGDCAEGLSLVGLQPAHDEGTSLHYS